MCQRVFSYALTPGASGRGDQVRWPKWICLNRLVATHAMNLLEQPFRVGSIEFHGEFLSPRHGIYSTVPVDPRQWALVGYTPAATPPPFAAAA